jgi:hypothetical protein
MRVDVDELRSRVATWEKARERAIVIEKKYQTPHHTDLELRAAAGKLCRLIRSCGPGVRGVMLEGRVFLDCTDPFVEAIAASSDAIPWHVIRFRVSRPDFHPDEPWMIIDADPPA